MFFYWMDIWYKCTFYSKKNSLLYSNKDIKVIIAEESGYFLAMLLRIVVLVFLLLNDLKA